MQDRYPGIGTNLEQLARVLVLIGALSIAVVGLVVGGLGMLVSFVDAMTDLLVTLTVSASFLVLTVGLGSMLAWHAWQSIQGQGSSPFRPRRVWTGILLFLLVVLAGQLILSLDLLPPLTFPPFHIAAAILPPVVILAAVGRSLGGVARWREIVALVSSGAFLSTFLAFTLEFAVVVGLVVVVLAALALQPGGLDMLQTLADHLQDPSWLQDPANLAPLATSPIVVVAALVVVAGLIPLIEEAVKTVGVGLLAYRRPRLSQAFLWGLACGAGFAMAEGLLNTAGGLDSWAFVVTLRVGAALLHTFTGGLMGMAWYYALVERRWPRWLGLYAASVGVHGLWNALAAGVTFVSLASGDVEMSYTSPGLAGIGITVILALLVFLIVAVGLGMSGLTRYVRSHSPALPGSDGEADGVFPGQALSDGGFGEDLESAG